MSFNKICAMNLKEVRKEKKMFTQQALAKKLKIDQAVVSRLENGKQQITVEYLDKFFKAHGMRVFISFTKGKTI
jgi:transcriptional regulator with XRE-family HTH domain